ncbi:hypothetical protein Goarm_018286 [Gossypium armourianum]|uniref:Uncharacterized protein n=1 Tax=Gossypium armourianum TaxID=34283 RepID=A0A7J9IH50_9ROSI|nr:hypothetical protein [Gossypium armourianum]
MMKRMVMKKIVVEGLCWKLRRPR